MVLNDRHERVSAPIGEPDRQVLTLWAGSVREMDVDAMSRWHIGDGEPVIAPADRSAPGVYASNIVDVNASGSIDAPPCLTCAQIDCANAAGVTFHQCPRDQYRIFGISDPVGSVGGHATDWLRWSAVRAGQVLPGTERPSARDGQA
jgi:hypothetical protein